MSGHCLRRLPNFNSSVNAFCFWCVKKHLPVIPPGISLASCIQSHTLALASQAVGQCYIRRASIKPLLVQCFVLAVLSNHWTGTMLGSVNVRQWWDSVYTLNPFVTSPGDLRDLGRPFRYEPRRSPGLIT